LLALWRASVRDREPAARSTLTIVADFAADTEADVVRRCMQALTDAIGEVDPQPVRLLAQVAVRAGHYDDLAAAIRDLDEPYWSATA
jgi:hypothetical protein